MIDVVRVQRSNFFSTGHAHAGALRKSDSLFDLPVRLLQRVVECAEIVSFSNLVVYVCDLLFAARHARYFVLYIHLHLFWFVDQQNVSQNGRIAPRQKVYFQILGEKSRYSNEEIFEQTIRIGCVVDSRAVVSPECHAFRKFVCKSDRRVILHTHRTNVFSFRVCVRYKTTAPCVIGHRMERTCQRSDLVGIEFSVAKLAAHRIVKFFDKPFVLSRIQVRRLYHQMWHVRF